MAGKPPKRPDDRDSTAREVDRLLRQLPGADPSLQSDPDQPPPKPQPQPPMTGTQRPVISPPPRLAGRPRAGPTPAQQWGMWGRVAAGVVLGIALTQWPYRAECGWSLYAYLAAVVVLLVVAGWAVLAAWRLRNGPAHTIALIVGFWGIVLSAEQILPRVGYAAEAHTWTCQAAPAPAATPVAPALPVDSLADTAAATDTTGTPGATDTTTGGP